MSTILNPYLSFRDNAKEAMAFYQSVFGGEVNSSTFGDMASDPAERDLIMHSQLTTPNGFTLMVADTPTGMDCTPGSAYSVSLSGDDEAELTGYWDKLADGALAVGAPLMKAPWGDTFGMCTDKFGVNWMVNIAGNAA